MATSHLTPVVTDDDPIFDFEEPLRDARCAIELIIFILSLGDSNDPLQTSKIDMMIETAKKAVDQMDEVFMRGIADLQQRRRAS